MRTRIAIDPNVRVRGNGTYAGFEDVEGLPVVGGPVEVWEPESGVRGSGLIREIDRNRRLIYLDVDWASLTLRAPETAPQYIANALVRVSQASVQALCTMPTNLGANLDNVAAWLFESEDMGCERFIYNKFQSASS